MPFVVRRSSFPAASAFFTLPHGSRVHLNPETHAWTPEWLSVADERDLISYRILQAALQALPVPLEQTQVTQAVTGLDGCQMRWVAPPKSNPTTLPSPLARPAVPQYGSLTGYMRGTPEARGYAHHKAQLAQDLRLIASKLSLVY